MDRLWMGLWIGVRARGYIGARDCGYVEICYKLKKLKALRVTDNTPVRHFPLQNNLFRDITLLLYWLRKSSYHEETVIGASLSEPHTYCTAVQNLPFIYIRAVGLAGVQFGPAKDLFKRATRECQTDQ